MSLRSWIVCLLLVCGVLPASNRASAQGRASTQDRVPVRNTGPIILAHRGGAHEFEENTLEGFRACYERGIRGFETDIRMTKDGVLVILHDDSLDRTHNGSGAVEHKTAAELREVTTKKGQKLLFLDEFLEYFADKPGVYIELEMKTGNKTLYPDDRIADYCRKLYSAAQPRRADGSTYIYTSFCQLNGTSRAAVLEARKNGLLVNGWPGRSVQDYYLALGLGLDVHCTDIPTVIQGAKEKLPESPRPE